MSKVSEVRVVNPLLGAKPSIGPIPADQVVWWVVFALGSYLVGAFLGWSFLQMGMLILWLCATWWILTGSRPWRYLAKWQSVPRWCRAGVRRDEVLVDQ